MPAGTKQQRTLGTAWRIVIAAAATMILGGLGGFVTRDAMPTWYASLDKPSFQPPDSWFGPVWTILYAMMGIGAGMIWSAKAPRHQRGRALGTYSVQLGLNIAWSLIFFGFRSPELALVEIVILWIAILITIQLFHRINRFAALLLVPYLLWVTFAAVLNGAIVALN